jgi:hypothetical protein
MIKLRFTTLDGIRKTKSFKTLAGARKAAQGWVGADAEIGMSYAVSADGVVKVTAEGCSLQELFSDGSPEPQTLGMHFRVKVDGEYIKQTFKYQQELDRFMEEHSDITYDKPDGSIGVYQVEAELWTDEGGTLRKLEPPKTEATTNDEEIPF